MQSFIEKQFPVSKVSKESYKERKAVQSQTLTGMGRWWGRKPLLLVRAAILGCLMPASDNPAKDKEIFLKILSMDEEGLLLRKEKAISTKDLYETVISYRTLRDRYEQCFDSSDGKLKIKKNAPKAEIEKAVFLAKGYDEKIALCKRPEQLENISDHAWNEINHHLHTNAHSLQELVNQLSMQRYGHNIIVGDCFCGGGSIPFEAARMGSDVYGSDLNPVAGLLTWASVNICTSGRAKIEEIRELQEKIYNDVSAGIVELGIETKKNGDRALGYLYCTETICPECHKRVPLLSSRVIGKRAGKVIVRLVPNETGFDIEVVDNVNEEEFDLASSGGTVSDNILVCPNCGIRTPLSIIRKDRINKDGNVSYGLREMGKDEYKPAQDDIFQERLYAIRYLRPDKTRYYCSPDKEDLIHEETVLAILDKHFGEWQDKGWIPSDRIEDGEKTDELIRNRGWRYWHQLYSPRQLIYMALLSQAIEQLPDKLSKVACLLGLNKCADFSSKLCGWTASVDISTNTFYNQALNPLINWGERSFYMYTSLWNWAINEATDSAANLSISLKDARDVEKMADVWVTDPPYADAVNYHELSEYFLAWDKHYIQELFPDWYTDSKRTLAVRGDEHFSQTMIDIYSNLTHHMNDDGLQVVMFTHSDPAVWAQLALIMWKAGLTVTAAWNIATETDASGLKDGNYVKGTVLLVLRKQRGDETAFLDELNADIKSEVQNQIKSMQKLDDKEDPNFSDPDYVLAAYAASLKVLTSYHSIGEIDLDYELDLAIHDPAKSEVVKLIERAKKIAYDSIIPTEFDSFLWKELSAVERFYIKGLEAEKHGNYQVSTYQEYARGFGLSNYNQMMSSDRANTARLKTPTEFAMRSVDVGNFEDTLLRHVLIAIHISVKDENPEAGLFYLKTTLPTYWESREMIKQLLGFMKDTKSIDTMPHWNECGEMAEHLYNLVDHDHV